MYKFFLFRIMKRSIQVEAQGVERQGFRYTAGAA